MKSKEERLLTWKEVRAKINRFVLALGEAAPASADMFNDAPEVRAVAHRLPSSWRDWDRI
jgi:hypothetical protein